MTSTFGGCWTRGVFEVVVTGGIVSRGGRSGWLDDTEPREAEFLGRSWRDVGRGEDRGTDRAASEFESTVKGSVDTRDLFLRAMDAEIEDSNLTLVVVITLFVSVSRTRHPFWLDIVCPYPRKIPLTARGEILVICFWIRTNAVTPKGLRWHMSGFLPKRISNGEALFGLLEQGILLRI